MKMLLSGNEAIALGAREAGIYFGVGYPGTPSTEILETFARIPGIKAQWSPNEKVAFEVGIGAALAGSRTLVTMKHVGVNVAMDPLMTFAYTGTVGGFVFISADDPELHSSQNEQDNRILARFAKIPMLEPSDSSEAHDFMKYAIEISEKFETPLMLRITTRISHAKGIVNLEPWPVPEVTGFKRNPERFVMIPQYARKRHTEVEKRIISMREFSNNSPLNRVEPGTGNIGIVTGGVSYNYVREVMPDAPIFKVGMSNPMPIDSIREFAATVDKLLVVEELEPYYEEQILAAGIACAGKEYFPIEGELNPDIVEAGLIKAGALDGSTSSVHPVGFNVLPRPPVLCSGCPHRPVYQALKKIRADVFGDIGCYTLGALKPLNAMHACICMGASIGMADGVQQVSGSKKPVVAVIGDSTFLHSGITGLLDAVYNQAPMILVILDNRATAMTGGQQHPGTGFTLQGEVAPQVNLFEIVKALGVKRVYDVDSYDLDKTIEILTEASEIKEPTVLITSQPCVLYPEKLPPQPFDVDLDKCNACQVCLHIGCPSISHIDQTTEKGLHLVAIDPDTCTGCSLCDQVCPEDAIFEITHEHAPV
ncbi:MAG: indolepyruvate ferredoxin oxidoreductase subunit alpha [Calditrichaeota bacterium]|nr:indolepyruvate ferredoxin oxidoreductase subunit alpha [Calditrichota bacterium]MBT7788596.1 indolepyruvate ferredoxin oxidoreductase subunit alpha [Calditrichota bacterium]